MRLLQLCDWQSLIIFQKFKDLVRQKSEACSNTLGNNKSKSCQNKGQHISSLQIIETILISLNFQFEQTKMDAPPLSQQQLTQVYNWVDQIPLSRPKKNITRDFADGVMLAELISHYFPKLVETHNYITSTSAATKLSNWNTLNKKVLKKLNYQISKTDIEHIITATPDVIERVLKMTHNKIKAFMDRKKNEDEGKQEVPKEKEFQKISKNNELKDVMNEIDNAIKQLKNTVEILQLKIQKMQQLIKIKDSKIQSLVSKLQQAGIN